MRKATKHAVATMHYHDKLAQKNQTSQLAKIPLVRVTCMPKIPDSSLSSRDQAFTF
jgi:hypothetical protein